MSGQKHWSKSHSGKRAVSGLLIGSGLLLLLLALPPSFLSHASFVSGLCLIAIGGIKFLIQSLVISEKQKNMDEE
ncbi:MAG: hypothetical protein WCS52_18380 [bacterium]